MNVFFLILSGFILLVISSLIIYYALTKGKHTDLHTELNNTMKFNNNDFKEILIGMDKKITENKNQITKNENKITENENQIIENENQITENENHMTSYDKQLTKTEKKMKQYILRVGQNKEAYIRIENEVNKNKDRLFELETNAITDTTMSLLDLAEFKTLDNSIKQTYKIIVVNQVMPFIINYLNIFFTETELKQFLENNTFNIAIIAKHVFVLLKLNTDTHFTNWINNIKLEQEQTYKYQYIKQKIVTNGEYIFGTFIPALLERLNKQIDSLQNNNKNELIRFENKTLIISNDENTLFNYTDFDQNKQINFLNETDIRNVFDQFEIDKIFELYANILIRSIQNDY